MNNKSNNIFNVILKSVLDLLNISAVDIGLESQHRTRGLPTSRYFNNRTIDDFKKLAKASIITPDDYRLSCKDLFYLIEKERDKYHLNKSNVSTDDIIGENIAGSLILKEASSYGTLKKLFSNLEERKNANLELVIEFFAAILFEAFNLATITNNLVKKLAYDKETVLRVKKGKDNTKKRINNQRILDFENHELDILEFSKKFEINFYKGLVLSFCENSYDGDFKNIFEEAELLDGEKLPSDYMTLKEMFLNEIRDSLCNKKIEIAISKLCGMIAGASKQHLKQHYLSLIPEEYVLDPNALIESLDILKNYSSNELLEKSDEWFDDVQENLVPIDLVLIHEKFIRETFENIVYKIDDEQQLYVICEGAYVALYETQENIPLSKMQRECLTYVSAYDEFQRRKYPEEYSAKKSLGIWPPIDILGNNSRFCDDCLTYINSISDKAQTRHDAIEYLKMILEINKIANNEYAVALCNTAIFNLYTCSDKDYEATRDECWKGVGEEEPPNPEIGKLKKELAELDNKLSALYNE